MKPPLSEIMGSTRRVADAKRDHPVDANKMVCRHAPSEPVAALVHVCKHCGVPIEAVDCKACDGTGRNMDPESEGMWCKECDSYGIDRWEEAE